MNVMILAAPGRLRDGLQALLASYLDAEPLVAGEGQPAAEAIRDVLPDLVILDAGWLGAGTAALVQEVKSHWSRMGCIVMVDRIAHFRAMQEAGADHVLLRGFSVIRLFEAVDALRRRNPGGMSDVHVTRDASEPALRSAGDPGSGPAHDDVLPGTRWAVTAYAMGPGLATPQGDAAFTLEFTLDARVNVYAACSYFTATYAAEGDALSVAGLSGDTNLCDPAAVKHVNAFLAAISAASSFKMLGNHLYITNATGLRMLECAQIEATNS